MVNHIVIKVLLVSWVLVLYVFGLPAEAVSQPSKHQVSALILSKDEEVRMMLIRQLRKSGPAALEELMALNPKLKDLDPGIQETIEAEVRKGGNYNFVVNEIYTKWKRMVERVSRQFDAHYSGLYWYTDMAEAKAAANASHKPILSLRLMGRLDEDLSCLNSRYFRTVLYANKQVSRLLRDRFVLHWSSVRPVPVITTDLGNGRKITRTAKGYASHYILDSNGRPLDVLPGLYGPKAFIRALMNAREAHQLYVSAASPSEAEKNLKIYHTHRFAKIGIGLRTDFLNRYPVKDRHAVNLLASHDSLPYFPRGIILSEDDEEVDESLPPLDSNPGEMKGFVDTPLPWDELAEAIGNSELTPEELDRALDLTRSQIDLLNRLPPDLRDLRLKAMVNPKKSTAVKSAQALTVDQIKKKYSRTKIVALEKLTIRNTTDMVFEKPAIIQQIAARHIEDALLDEASRDLMFEKEGGDKKPWLSFSGFEHRARSPFEQKVHYFEVFISIMTIRNEYFRHSGIHRWFVMGHESTKDMERLDNAINHLYVGISKDDSWFGLLTRDTYLGLSDAGLQYESAQSSN